MTEACTEVGASTEAGAMSATHSESGCVAALGAAGWVNLAAAPVFAVMALIAGLPGGDQPGIHCAAGQHASPLSGMVLMYVLMSIFHAAPWLRLISGRRASRRR